MKKIKGARVKLFKSAKRAGMDPGKGARGTLANLDKSARVQFGEEGKGATIEIWMKF